MNVHVLVTCRGAEHLPLSLLVFDTIRVGFPTARVHVVDNGSDFGNEKIKKAALSARALYDRWPRGEHGDFIARVLETATDPTVFIDTDVIFWENCEGITLPEGRLYGGRLIPEGTIGGARMPARIHPSLLFIPDPVALRARLASLYGRFWYFRPFQGFTVIEGDKAICYDTCASLYAALPEAAHPFGGDVLDRYHHLFAGTYPDRFEEMGMAADTATLIRRTHEVALGPDRNSLRGFWRQQFPLYDQPKMTAWHYWSGILYEGDVPRLGFVHATFDVPGAQPFAHTSIVDLGTKKVYAGEDESLGFAVPRLPFPDARPQAAGDEYYSTDTAVDVCSLELTIGGIQYHNLNGVLWYECERRTLRPEDGWRWISLRLNDGRRVLLYDQSNLEPRHAILKDEGWSPIDAEARPLEHIKYESKWSVRVGSEEFTVVPVAPDQEIVDAVHGIRYLEALCTVYSGNDEVGTAYVEIVPAMPLFTTQGLAVQAEAAQARPIVSIPSDQEMHLRWAKGNKEAAFLMDLFGYATQVADDLVDADTAGVATLEGRSEAMARLLYCLLIQIPGNPFFRANEGHFIGLFPVLIAQWDASNTWGKARKLETRMFSYVTRAVCGRLLEQVAYVIGGLEWMRQVTREIHDYYYGESGRVESFADWEKEQST